MKVQKVHEWFGEHWRDKKGCKIFKAGGRQAEPAGPEILKTYYVGTFRRYGVSPGPMQPGVVSAPSVWWSKLVPGGRNANSTTSEEITDIGGGATFYDKLVDVRLAD